MSKGGYLKAAFASCALLCVFAVLLFVSSGKTRVAVCPFQVVCDGLDKNDGARAAGRLSEMLGGTDSVETVDGAGVVDFMRDMSVVVPFAVLEGVAARSGAAYVLSGTLDLGPDGVVVSVVALNAATGKLRIWQGGNNALKQAAGELFSARGRVIGKHDPYFSRKLSQYVQIPAGTITLGNHPKTAKKSSYAAFMAARRCVSNAEYKEFIDATGHAAPFVDAPWARAFNWRGTNYPEGRKHTPVVLVSWDDAAAFAAWKGLALPTRTQWLAVAKASVEKRFFSYPGFFEWTSSSYTGTDGVDPGYEDYVKPGEVFKYIFSGNFFHSGVVVPSRWALPYISRPENRFGYVGFRCVKPVGKDA